MAFSMHQRYSYSPITFVLLILIALPSSATARNNPDHTFLSISSEKEQCGSPSISANERRHAEITAGLQRTSIWLDNFFGDDREQDSLAKSSLRLSLDGSYIETETGNTKVRLRGKIDLPRLKKRLQLVFEGEPEDSDVTGLENTSSSASLRYKLKNSLLRETSVSVGLRGGLKEPRLFFRVRSSTSKKRKQMLLRITPIIGLDTDEGWESNLRADFEYALSARDYFRITSNPQWQEDTSGISFQQDFSYFHRLSRRTYLAADWLNTFVNRPRVRLDLSRYRIRYRRNLWKNRLFLEVSPGVRFAEALNYEMQWELGSKLELLFEP